MKVPVLETDRLIIRQLQDSDAPDLFQYYAKDEVTQYYDIHSLSEVSEATYIIRYWMDACRKNEALRWAMTLKDNPKLIGTCGFHHLNAKHQRAELGFDLSPLYWNRGYMLEAIQAIIAYGFQAMNFNRIEAMTFTNNVAARKLLQKTGFMEEGIKRQYFMKNNTFFDIVMYAMLKKHWSAQPRILS